MPRSKSRSIPATMPDPAQTTATATATATDDGKSAARSRPHADANPAAKTRAHLPAQPAAPGPMPLKQVYSWVAQESDLTREQVREAFGAISLLIQEQLQTTGQFRWPGLLRIEVVQLPARPERPNPFAPGKVVPARPARAAVRVRPLKALQECV